MKFAVEKKGIMELTGQEIWQKSLDIVRDNVTSELFNQWLAPIVPVKFEHDILLVQVPTYFYIEQIEAHYADLIGKSLNRIAGHPIQLNYQVKISGTAINLTSDFDKGTSTPHIPARSGITPFTEIPVQPFDSQLNASLNFKTFIEGTSNKLARTAGLSIAKEPGKTIFNPLFIHGKSGVGKTHLLHAIGNAVKENNPKSRVLYLSAHLFQVQYSQAYLQNNINDFIHFYQSVDVLLLDDVHELAGKQGTQNAFFHIFNQLHQTGKQLVFTCDRSPKDLKGIEDRLLTRFKWGLTAEMLPPDYQLRLDILNSKIAKNGLNIPAEVVTYIARNARDNVRDLEGITTSLMAHSIIENRSIDLELCREVVNNTMNVKPDNTELSIEAIESQVSQYYHIDVEALHSRSKMQDVAKARQIVMYLAKKHTSKSLSMIGDAIGKRSHATVIHACKTVEEWIETEVAIKNDITHIESSLEDCN